HGDARDERRAGGDSALEAARVVAQAAVSAGEAERGIGLDLVVDGGAGQARGGEAHADLDALHRLDGHERVGDPAVELAIPGSVAAEADRQTGRDDLE